MRKSKKTAAIAGLTAVLAIGSSFAYFNQTMKVENPFDTGKYDGVLSESFKPADGENWEPGATVNKDIEVKNTGDYDLLVRVKFDEEWINRTTHKRVIEHEGLDAATSQVNANDGLVDGDGSVVEKVLQDDNWVYNAGDNYWYYTQNLAAKATTGTFLDAVKLLEDADMGEYIVTNYYTMQEDKPDFNEANIGTDPTTQWVVCTSEVPENAVHTMAVTTQSPDAPGYGNAEYTLTITAETVQATKAAMKDAFELDDVPVGCSWILGNDTTT